MADFRANTRNVVLLALVTFGLCTEAATGQDLRVVDAAANQDNEVVRTLVSTGVDVNTARPDGATALLWATHWNNLDIVDLLLSKGANINASDDHGVTPLERAAENASSEMIARLLAAGANVNASQTSGLTSLMTAARTGNADIVTTLITAGANVNATVNTTQSTALMWAVSEPHPEVVRILLNAGADPHVSTSKGFTPLMFAARNGDINTAKSLIAAGVNVNDLSADDTHVLPFSIISGQDAFALFLLDAGANANGSMDGVHALHAASGSVSLWLGDWYRRHGRNRLYARPGRSRLNSEQRLPLVKALLEKGAAPDARITTSAMVMSYIGYPKKGAFEPFACGTGDLRNATPLWVAAFDMNGAGGQVFSVGESRSNSNVEILELLLAAGADQQLTTDDGTTPLMAAAGLGRATYTPREPRGVRAPSAENAIRVLLDAGADVNSVNEADYTALHGAAFRGLNEVIEYLVLHGANLDARDFRGRTPYRLAEGSKQSFQFQSWPETAALLAELGANTELGIAGTVQERLRDVPAESVTDQP